MFDLQHVLRASLDRVGDCLAVSRAKYKRPEDQHVQGSLNHLGLKRGWAFRHIVLSMID
jgi:hypothetical protein